MKALRLHEFGDLDKLGIEEVPTPEPREGECLIRIRAAGVNPSDVKNALGSMNHTTLPRVLGRDFAGTVERGPETMVGKDVYGTGGDLGFTRDGTHAEYVSVPCNAVAEKPKTLSFEEAASVGTPFVTAWQAIVALGRVQPGDKVAVWGAAGSVGSAACQIVKAQGAKAIGIVLPGDNAPDADETVTDPNSIQNANLVLNTVGGTTFGDSLAMLANFGRQVLISTNPDRVQKVDLLDFYRRNLSFLGLNTLLLDAVHCAEILAQLRPGFESGAYRIKKPSVVPLLEARETYRRINAAPGEKIVLMP